jgi:hypothetical protein
VREINADLAKYKAARVAEHGRIKSTSRGGDAR